MGGGYMRQTLPIACPFQTELCVSVTAERYLLLILRGVPGPQGGVHSLYEHF